VIASAAAAAGAHIFGAGNATWRTVKISAPD